MTNFFRLVVVIYAMRLREIVKVNLSSDFGAHSDATL